MSTRMTESFPDGPLTEQFPPVLGLYSQENKRSPRPISKQQGSCHYARPHFYDTAAKEDLSCNKFSTSFSVI